MKLRVSIVIFAALLIFAFHCVLAGSLRNIEDPAVMKKTLESQIIAPSSISTAKQSMEAEGFKCSFRTDSTFGKHMRYLYCVREDQRPRPALWEIALEISGSGLNGNVAVIKTFPKSHATETHKHSSSHP